MAATLDERIAAAFEDGVASADVAGLIEETEAAADAAGKACEVARESALDPRLSDAGVADARREMEDAAFRRDRLQEALRRLGQRRKKLSRREHQSRLCADYDAAAAERDALAAELAEVYPPLAEKLADLMARIVVNDAVIERINRKGLPDDATRLREAELVARGLQGFFADGAHVPRITQQLRLPAFEQSGQAQYAWPRPQR